MEHTSFPLHDPQQDLDVQLQVENPQFPLDYENCPVHHTLLYIGGKWRLSIIYCLKSGVMRYGELKRAIPDMSEKMLIQELRECLNMGIVEKKVFPEVPPRVEYYLTNKGKSLIPILDLVVSWGTEHLKEIGKK